MKYFPVFFDLDERAVVLVGNGLGIEAKLTTLLKTNAVLRVHASDPSDTLRTLAEDNRISLSKQLPTESDLRDAALVYLDGQEVRSHRNIRALCKVLRVPVNSIDNAASSDFISSAIVDRDPIVVAISSSGAAPVFVRKIKSRIESLLRPDTGAVARLAQLLRPRVFTALGGANRRQFWQAFFSGKASDRLRRHGLQESRRIFQRELADFSGNSDALATNDLHPIALVGAGPGDPELLTLKARKLIDEAEVILFDRLVSPAIMDLARREATLIEVGKRPGGKSWTQEDINQALIDHGRAGSRVVRLKSGDPMIFGRADEELDALQAAGLDYQVVPGVTSASAASASIGTSLTRRDRNSAFSFLTAQDVRGFAEHDWRALAETGATAAVYMGVRAARFLQGRLLLHGAKANTPICVVENASREDERIIDFELGSLSAEMQTHNVQGPAIIFVGLRSREVASQAAPALQPAV